MLPKFQPGDIVIATRRSIKVGRVVIASVKGRDVVKRVAEMSHDTVYLLGDNPAESTDSRHYGSIERKAIQSVVIMKSPFAHATPAPPVTSLVRNCIVYVCAAVAVIFALLHLFRIDLWIETMQALRLFTSPTANVLLAAGLLLAEVFGLAVLLRLSLSRLARAVSAALVVIAPWAWLMISIGQVGEVSSTGQFGSYIDTPGGLWLIVLNLAWLALAVAAVAITKAFDGLRLSKP